MSDSTEPNRSLDPSTSESSPNSVSTPATLYTCSAQSSILSSIVTTSTSSSSSSSSTIESFTIIRPIDPISCTLISAPSTPPITSPTPVSSLSAVEQSTNTNVSQTNLSASSSSTAAASPSVSSSASSSSLSSTLQPVVNTQSLASPSHSSSLSSSAIQFSSDSSPNHTVTSLLSRPLLSIQNSSVSRSTSIGLGQAPIVETKTSFASSITQRLTRKKPLKKAHKNKRSISMLEESTGAWNSIMEQQQQQQPGSSGVTGGQQNLNNSSAGSPPPPPLPPPSARLGASQSFINDITKPLKRNVVVQRDASGFGIRISGDNPVSIESVTPDGAAHRAGVRNGDQILKINGSLATKMSHADVVKMIRNCGSYVSLHLLTLPRSAQQQQSQQQQQSPLAQSSSLNAATLSESPAVSSIQSPAVSPTPTYGKIIKSSNTSSLVHSNSFQNNLHQHPSLSTSGTISGLPHSRQITLPLPVAENTQKEYMKNQIETLQRFIQSETEHLGTLKDPEKIEKCKDKIANFRAKLQELLDAGAEKLLSSTVTSSFDTSNATSPANMSAKVGPQKSYQLRSQFGERFDSDDDDSQQILPIGNEIPFQACSSSSSAAAIVGLSGIAAGPDDVYHQQSGIYDPSSSVAGTPSSAKCSPQRQLGLAFTVQTPKQKRDSKSFDHSNLPISLENIHEHSLRFARYLIQNHVIPHAMLFLVTTKRIFPEIVASAARKIINNCMIGSDNQINGLKQLIQRWASQIMATWVVKESPLYFHEFSPEQMSQYDQQLSHFTLTIASRSANSGPAANPFDIFLEETRDIVGSQLLEFQQAIQNKPEVMLTKPKEDLQAMIEQLLLSVGGSASPGLKLDIRDVDPIFDQLIHNTNETAVTTMAVISGLLTVGHFEFGYSSKHLLLSDVNACVSQIPTVSGLSGIVASTFNPVMKLSDVSSTKKGNHKRNVSLPASTRPSQLASNSSFDASLTASGSVNLPSGGISEQDHYFVMVNDLTTVEYCRGKCQLTLWGDHYNYQCVKCKLLAHFWCLKQAANDHLCVAHNTEAGVVMRHNNTANVGNNRKKRTSKSDPHKKTSVIEKLTSKVSKRPTQELFRTESTSSSSTSISLSSSSSASDFEDFPGDDENQNLIVKVGKIPSFSSGSTVSVTSPTVQQANMPTDSTNVPRSGSFNQRRRGKMSTSSSTPRKRSDPALTSRNMSTIHGHMTETSTPTLTSAQSSGALVGASGIGVFHHSSSFCGDSGATNDNGHGFKNSNASQFSAYFPMLNRKNMTASDSSLLSSTQTIQPGSQQQQQQQSATNLQRQSSSTSQRASKRGERKKTADSAIHMDANITSESDGESEATLRQRTEEDPNVDPIVSDEQFGPPPPLPPPSNPRSDPPPLPPRPHVSEKRRQIKEEIVESEISHFQTLKYIRDVYYLPLKEDKILSTQELSKIFLNIRKLQSVHRRMSEQIQKAFHMDNESGDSHYFELKLLEIFSGKLGKKLQEEASYFCINQKIGNGMEIWNKKRNHATLRALFDNDLKTKEMPDNPNARLNLPDLMGKVFQRPLRYPLLLGRLLGATPKDSESYNYLLEAENCTKQLGDAINETTKKHELKTRLEEIIRKTDSKDSPILNELIEQRHELIHEGPLTWKLSRSKSVEVLGVLTNKMLLVFGRDSSGDRYFLKKMTNPQNKRPLKLDIRLDDLLIRKHAVDGSGIILISNSQEIFYEFDAPTKREADEWTKKILHTIEQYNQNFIPYLPKPHPAAVLRDLSTIHPRSKSSLPDMDHFTTSAAASAGTGHNVQSPNGTLPPNFVNRPLPEVPSASSHEPTATSSKGLSPSSSQTASTKFAGSIGGFIEKNELVDFDEVRITPKPKLLKAEVVNENDEAKSVDLRFRGLADRVERLKADMEELLVVCDLDHHVVEKDVKEKLFLDLLHMAIRIDNNNRPTREPFSELVSKSQTYIRSLNERNSPVHDGMPGPSMPDSENNHHHHQPSIDGGDNSDDQPKSQDSLQMLEISEFENKTKSSNNSDAEDYEPKSKNPFENGASGDEPSTTGRANAFYFGSDPNDFEIISANITSGIVDDSEIVLTDIIQIRHPSTDIDCEQNGVDLKNSQTQHHHHHQQQHKGQHHHHHHSQHQQQQSVAQNSTVALQSTLTTTITTTTSSAATPPTTTTATVPAIAQVPVVVDPAWGPDSVKPKGEIFSL